MPAYKKYCGNSNDDAIFDVGNDFTISPPTHDILKENLPSNTDAKPDEYRYFRLTRFVTT